MARQTRTPIEKLEYRVSRLLKEAELIRKTAGELWTAEMAKEAEDVIYNALDSAFEDIRAGKKSTPEGFRFSRNLHVAAVNE